MDTLLISLSFSHTLAHTLVHTHTHTHTHTRTHQYAVEVLGLVKRTLPIISMATKVLEQSIKGDDSGVYSDTKHLHYATVETSHPYQPVCVSHYKVTSAIRGVRHCKSLP